MLQLIVERIRSFADIEDVYTATNQNYKKIVREQLPELPEGNIICEPMGKNTAPCIGLGAIHIAKNYEDAIMMVLPSDHLIKHNKIFVKTLKDAIEIAEKDINLVTLGIAHIYSETGYADIKFDIERLLDNGYVVECFVEKPNYELAKEYVSTGEYLWNSGMFVWKISLILMNIDKFMSEMMQELGEIKNAIGTEDEINVLSREFSEFKSKSMRLWDYGKGR